jgi:hypothetical protein
MKYLKSRRQFIMLGMAGLLFTACDKVDKVDPIGDRGQTIVKILEGGTPGSKLYAIDFVTTPTSIIGADIRRDVPNNTELNKSMVVTVKDDTAAVSAAGLTHLDPSWYTLGSGVTKVGGEGGIYTVTFAPGELAKQINIVIPDATLLDPSETYGLGFTIMTADANGHITADKSLVVSIGAKNMYDGIYKVVGTFAHPTADYVGPFGTPGRGEPLEVALVTTGANTVSRLAVAPADVAGFDGFLFWSTADDAFSGFSNVFPEYSIDPGTNVVTVYSNNPANSVTWINYNSIYDPATKTFLMDYGYNSAARRMQETWIYLRPR